MVHASDSERYAPKALADAPARDSERYGDRAILLRFHEIALKGLNRGWFEEKLATNVRKLVERSIGQSVKVSRERGRVIVRTPWNPSVCSALRRVFGLTSFSPIRTVPTEKEGIVHAAMAEFQAYVDAHGLPGSFRVETRRSEKAIPETSVEFDYYAGGVIHDAFPGLKVNLKNPEITLGIEIHQKHTHLWLEKIPAPGGLPVGTNAKTLALLSGGLDSPVAAIQILRRGSPVSYLHFHGAPFVGDEVITKIEDLVRVVNQYQPDPQPLHVIPFGKIQEKIALATNPKLRTVLYRRMMFRIASEVARKLRARALITGESLGQVASQTVENMAAINSVATFPVLRPLVAYDKDEIIAEAKAWGTYDISIRPAVDCCTLFADRHPAIRARLDQIAEQEARFPVEEYVTEAIQGLSTVPVP